MRAKNIIIIGAGQLGSRHLQALKKVKLPLNIQVVDPSGKSLEIARTRYNEIKSKNYKHEVIYSTIIDNSKKTFDIAIIATNSDVRYEVIKDVTSKHEAKNIILEKLLFQKREDYQNAEKLFEKKQCRVWVDCSMRTMPFFSGLKKKFRKEKIMYQATGSLFGLATNSIHLIDHMIYLTECRNFSVETGLLDSTVIASKRKGFLELTGTLIVKFSNGSIGVFTSFSEGNLPLSIDITSRNRHCFLRRAEKLALVGKMRGGNWNWQKENADLPLQSEMTTKLVEDMLLTDSCPLPTYTESSRTHLVLLDSLLNFVNKHSKEKISYYPFT